MGANICEPAQDAWRALKAAAKTIRKRGGLHSIFYQGNDMIELAI